MPYAKPPALATWLLTRFGVNESVIGDLVERNENRRSSVWFWRQALATIAVCLVRDVRSHKFVTFRAVLAGTLAVWVFSWWLRVPWPLPWALAGWTIARFHRHNGLTMVVALISCWLLIFLSLLSVILTGLLPPGGTLTSASANALLATVIPRFLWFAACTFAGGLLGARPSGDHHRQRA
jgi:hypothetical protein